VKGNEDLTPSGETVPGKALENSPFKKFLRVLRVLRGENCLYRLKRPVKTKPKQESKRMRQQTGSRNRGWLPTIGNRLSVAAGVALVAGMMAGTAWGAPGLLATGGDVTNVLGPIDGKYYGVHSFTNVGSATFTPSQNLTVEYLVIGGGGGGGNRASWGNGGGGAGGLITSVAGEHSGGGTAGVGSDPNAPASLTASTAYNVTVGTGGGAAVKGGDSSFGSFATAVGGGYGDSGGIAAASSGGSGGGGGYTGPGGAGTAGQGWAGGAQDGDVGSGGGGAGNVGGNSSGSTSPGNGGPGLQSSITGSSLWYAGGGGGKNDNNGSTGTGGSGVGGNGGSAGTDGRGGGGGGRAKGGSGIVIVRYEIPPPPAGTLILMR
jgi:hypothetical protein